MIVKIWCWLFGHKRWSKAFTGEKDGDHRLYRQKWYSHCPRCGTELEEIKTWENPRHKEEE